MEWSSWFRRSLSTSKTSKQANQDEPNQSNRKTQKVSQEEILGVTQDLIQHVKSFTVETFENFPLSDEMSNGGSYDDEVNGSRKKTTPENVRKDLSEWQERHAVLVLSNVKKFNRDSVWPIEGILFGILSNLDGSSDAGAYGRCITHWHDDELSQLRFKLCPRVLKEQEFWRVYFSLVKSYTAEYELQAIRLAKLKSMATENERDTDGNAIEVEMAETKPSASLTPATP